MKKLILTLALLALLPMVFAGNSHDLNDFSIEPTQAIWLEERDEVRFDLVGGTHSIILDKINHKKSSVDLKIFKYITTTDSTAFYVSLKKDTILKTDMDRDFKDEVAIGLYKIDNDRAMLIFQLEKPDEKVASSEVVTGSVTDEPPKEQGVVKESNNWAFLLIGAAILLLIGSIFWKKK